MSHVPATSHVHLLWHVHVLGDEEDWKFIGVYSSPEQADAARARVLRLPGFRDTPADFRCEAVRVDEDQWTEGFVTVEGDGPNGDGEDGDGDGDGDEG